MPKIKASLGEIEIKTPEPAFREWFKAELISHKAWNPSLIHTFDGTTYFFKYQDKPILWKITLLPTGIRVSSLEKIVYLRHGIKIYMGSSRIEIS